LNDSWDDKTVRHWEEFTHVNTANIKDSLSNNNFFLCYQKAPLTVCARNVRSIIRSTLQQIKKDIKLNPDNANKIYGDVSKYSPDEKPLSVTEMKNDLESLIVDLKK
jgi:hypothetical protein